MQLDLLGWRRRGGARPGAGRKRSSRQVAHASRETFRNAVFHVTARVRRDLPTLRVKRIVRRIEASFRRGCERADFRLVHYSIQRDHVHLVVEAADAGALGRGVRALLIRIARAANAEWKRMGAVFGDRYHHRRLPTPREVRNAIAYVLRNARRHFGARVKSGWIDPASSGRWFWECASDAPAVALPRFWLLRAGWRRHGGFPP
jgi:REP element-mobilizing transposase RayT